ncbi:MAG: hypothetical protein ACR2K3_12590 [Nocardioides sp.]
MGEEWLYFVAEDRGHRRVLDADEPWVALCGLGFPRELVRWVGPEPPLAYPACTACSRLAVRTQAPEPAPVETGATHADPVPEPAAQQPVAAVVPLPPSAPVETAQQPGRAGATRELALFGRRLRLPVRSPRGPAGPDPSG